MEKHIKRKDIRLKGFDYRTPDYYFVTIVTNNRQCCLGVIEDSEPELSSIGEIVADSINNIDKNNDNIDVIESVVMPNHIHFLIGKYDEKLSLSDIIRNLKSYTTNRYYKLSSKDEKNFLWQKNYYEHIVRNQHAFDFIRNYIIQNPVRWQKDKLNGDCVNPDRIMEEVINLEK